MARPDSAGQHLEAQVLPQEENAPPPAEVAGGTAQSPAPDRAEPALEGWSQDSHWVRLPDGGVRHEFFFGPQFRQDGNRWLPLEPRVVSSDERGRPLRVEGGLLPASFGDRTDRLVRLEVHGQAVTLSGPTAGAGAAVGAAARGPRVRGNGVAYDDVAPDTDLTYTALPTGIKERIVLRSSNAPRRFTFHLSDPKGVLGVAEPGPGQSWRFSAPVSPGTYLTLPAPFAYEERLEREGALVPSQLSSATQKVQRAGDGWDITLALDEQRLTGLTFPIVLDPQLILQGESQLFDGSILHSERAPCYGGGCSVNETDPSVGAGTYTDAGENLRPARSVFRWNSSGIRQFSRVDTTNLRMYIAGCLGDVTYYCDKNDYNVQFYRFNADWNANSTYDQLNAISYGPQDGAFIPAYAPLNRNPVDFRVDNLTQSWFNGEPNFGFGMKLSSEPTSGSIGGPVFESADSVLADKRPRLVIDYTSPPSAPVNLTLGKTGDTSVRASWGAPLSDGGSAITSYTARLYSSTSDTVLATQSCDSACRQATFSGLAYGSYRVKVTATNAIHEGPDAGFSNTVTLAPAPGITKVLLSPAAGAAVGRGQLLTYKLTVTNPSTTTSMAVDSVVDDLPNGIAGNGVSVTRDGALCVTCVLNSAGDLSLPSFTLAAGARTDFVYDVVAIGVDKSCSVQRNTATARNSAGSTTSAVSVTVCDTGLGVENWWSYHPTELGPQSQAMVNVGTGNLVVSATDTTAVQARGRLAHVTRRTYNSQDTTAVSLPGALAAGWSMNVGHTDDLAVEGLSGSGLIVPSVSRASTPLAVTMVDRDGTRHSFRPRAASAAINLGLLNLSSALGTVKTDVLEAANLGRYASICVDASYDPPPGVHLSLWRYVGFNAADCTSTDGALPVALGFAAMRPDRVRYEYSATGKLLSLTDGSGNSLRYAYEQLPIAGVDIGRLRSVTEDCSAACRATTFTYDDSANTATVTDPAGRATVYRFTLSGVKKYLTAVSEPAEAGGAGWAYTYQGVNDSAGCAGATGQMCSVRDPRGGTTRFGYRTAGALAPPDIASVTDRRGHSSTFTYAAGRDVTTVDKAGKRMRSSLIDATGRVGQLDEGSTADFYRRSTSYTWDKPGATCRLRDSVVDNNLCAVKRAALTPDTPDELTEFLYGPQGQLYRERRHSAASPAVLDTTHGYLSNTYYSNGDSFFVSERPQGGGSHATNNTAPANPLYVLTDRVSTLPPRGNETGAAVDQHISEFSIARNLDVNPNRLNSGSCGQRNSGVLCRETHPHDGATRAVTSYEYDERGLRTRMTRPKGQVYQYSYYSDTDRDLSGTVNAGGWLRATTDPSSRFVVSAHDRAGNVIRTWDRNATAGHTVATFPVATAPRYAQTLYASSVTAAPWRWARSEQDPVGNTSSYLVDPHGNRTEHRTPRGNLTSATYDSGDNQLTSTRPGEGAGSNTRFGYDEFSNQTSVTSSLGDVSARRYDEVNRLTQTITSRGPDFTPTAERPRPPGCRSSQASDAPIPAGKLVCVSSLSYDGVNNTLSATDAAGATSQSRYDGVHRRVTMLVPRTATTSHRTQWRYDAAGNPLTVCPPREFTEGSGACTATSAFSVHQSYSTANRPVSTTTYRNAGAAGNPTSRSYDLNGNPVSTTDARGITTSQSFDALDRPVISTQPRSPGVTNSHYFEYDAVGNRTAVIAPDTPALGDGRHGALTVDGATYPASSPYRMAHDKQYSSVTLTNGGWIAPGGGQNRLSFTVLNTVTVCATCGITTQGAGHPGGEGSTALDSPGHPGAGLGPGQGGGRGSTSGGAGGGGAGHQRAGSPGTGNSTVVGGAGGPSYGDTDVTGTNADEIGSGGGGGGGTAVYNTGGRGGAGGGLLTVTAGQINNQGTISSAGAPGAPGRSDVSTFKGGGGGGGSGGVVYLRAPTITNSGTVTAAGGAGGGFGLPGGAGSNGRLRVDANVVSGLSPDGATRGWLGRVTAYSFDANNRLVDTVRGASDGTAAAAGLASADGGRNARTRQFYDEDSNVTAILDPRAFTSSLTSPDSRYLLRRDHDPRGRVSAMYQPRFDTAGHSDTGLSSDQSGQCTTSTRPAPVAGVPDYPSGVGVCQTRQAYDLNDNRTELRLPTSTGSDNRVVRYAYTEDDLLLRVDTPDPSVAAGTARVTTAEYLHDGAGRPVKKITALGLSSTTSYFSDGLVDTVTDQPGAAGAHVTHREYDANGAVTAERRQVGIDGAGAPVLRAWTTGYFADGLVKERVDSGGNRTSYAYDQVGNPTVVLSPSAHAPVERNNRAGQPTIYGYTDDNLLATSSVPVASDGSQRRHTTYSYDAGGRKSSVDVDYTDAGSTVLTDGPSQRFAYYPTDLLREQTGRNGETITSAYDPAGNARLTTMTPTVGAAVSTTSTFYLDGLPRTVTQNGQTARYSYDGSGARVGRADVVESSGSTTRTTYRHTDVGQPWQTTSDVTTGSTITHSYDRDGRPTGTAYPNGTSVARTFDTDNTLIRQQMTGPAGPISTWDYRYDGLYRVRSAGHNSSSNDCSLTPAPSGLHCYDYDTSGRVTLFKDSTATRTMTYDRNGNRLSYGAGETHPTAPTVSFTYNADDSIQTTATAGKVRFTMYPAPFGGPQNDYCTSYTYDGFDRLTQRTPSNDPECGTASAVSYAYDSWDRQVQRTESGDAAVAAGTTELRYDGLQPALASELRPSGEQVRYTLGEDSATPLAVARDGAAALTQFLATDGRGNVTTATAAAGGALQCAIRYDPYGTPHDLPSGSPPGTVCTNAGGKTATSILFAGARQDPSSGTYQLGSRTYDPAKSAFLTPDSYRTGHSTADLSVGVDPLTRNTYSYVNGDPVNLKDPTGHYADGGAGSSGHQALDRQQADRSYTGKQDLTCRTCSNGAARLNKPGPPTPAHEHGRSYNFFGGFGKTGWAAGPGLVSDLLKISPFRGHQAVADKLDSWEESLSKWYDADLESDAYRNGNYAGHALGAVGAVGGAIKVVKGVKAAAGALRRAPPAAAGSEAGSSAGAATGAITGSRTSSTSAKTATEARTVNYGALDDLGRPSGVTARLTPDMVGTGSPAARSIKPPGFGGGSAGHARGHLLGNQLGGSGTDPRNLVTMFQNPANSPVMRGFENQVRGALDSGQLVDYAVTPIYRGADLMPMGVTLHAQGSGGFNMFVTVLNRGL